MPNRRLILPLVALTVLALVVAPGCRKVDTTGPEEVPRPVDDGRRMPAPPPVEPEREPVEDRGFGRDQPSSKDLDAGLSAEELSRALRTIYFAYDSDDLSTQARGTLRDNAEWLKAHSEFGTVVHGHCDERGTIEYNLALGERRAASVRDYLVSLGVERSRIRIVTYGEERPIAPGHDESAWSRNRRAEFRVER